MSKTNILVSLHCMAVTKEMSTGRQLMLPPHSQIFQNSCQSIDEANKQIPLFSAI
ncbi:hypothetical protein IE4771_PB00205 (plasmid) [Rhizobium etli bv. mimosae str. IE4771]|uniref:Uncharacterized protein n=1 Tax=Rhizobium etli bv. mimosae str. IE4771 TaxID=1432050 RepID=A0A060ICZ1_RHIET|nr:hypothetical protein IE4771_PB00205 [Rhizobium sp. IE4771]